MPTSSRYSSPCSILNVAASVTFLYGVGEPSQIAGKLARISE
jgi:hypothetical protein